MNAQQIITESGITVEDYDEIEFVFRAIEAKYLDSMHEFEERFNCVASSGDMPMFQSKSYLEWMLKWRIACRLYYRGGAGAGSDYEIEDTYRQLQSLKETA